MTDYSALIPDSQKRSILEARQNQFALEAWQHDMNLTAATASGNTEVVDASAAALAALDSALATVADELAKLPAVV